jgi:hypothetical protein
MYALIHLDECVDIHNSLQNTYR